MVMLQKNEKKDGMSNGNDRISMIHSVSFSLLIIFFLGLFPLIYHDNYIDIQTSKAWAFRVAAGSFLIFGISVYFFSVIRNKEKYSRKIHLEDCFLVLFMVGITISAIFSRWPAYSFNGNMGRNVGTLDFLLLGGVFLLAMNRYHISKYILYIISFFSGLEFLVIILNFWGFDPLKMYENLIPEQYHIFIGTIGNINAASGFLCIVVSAYVAIFAISGGRYTKILYGLLALLGLYAGFASSCDSFLIGCSSTIILIVVYSFLLKKGIRILADGLLLFSIAAVLMRISLILAHRSSFSSPFISKYEKDSFLADFINSSVLLVCLCIAIVMRIMASLVSSDIQNYILRILFCSIPVMVCAGIALFLFVNMKPETIHVQTFDFLNRLVIDDEFGSGRGYIWRRSLDMWNSYPFFRKMIGCGTDCFYLQMVPEYGQEMMGLFDEVFVDAHSELLQLLVTTGLIGIVGYYGFWFGLLFRAIKRVKETPYIFVGIVSIGAYMAQAMINNIVPACIPLAFVVGALQNNYATYANC